MLLSAFTAATRGIDDVTISVHGHDDLGMAVANFMSAIEGGARQVGGMCFLFLFFFFVHCVFLPFHDSRVFGVPVYVRRSGTVCCRS